MKKIIFLLLGLILFSAAGPTVKVFAEKAVNEGKSWDFGRVKEGRVVKHNFTVKNEGAKTLTIKNITTSCGCAVSRIKKKVLSPEESTEVEVKFNSKGYSGAVEQYVYVETDNIEKPILKFIIKADVLRK